MKKNHARLSETKTIVLIAILCAAALTGARALRFAEGQVTEPAGPVCTIVGAPTYVATGQSFYLIVSLRNPDSQPLPSDLSLADRSSAPGSMGVSAVKPNVQNLGAGETFTQYIQMKAPISPGTYPLVWGAMSQGQGMGTVCEHKLDVRPALSNGAICAGFEGIPDTLEAGQRFSGLVKIRNTGTKPWQRPNHYIVDPGWNTTLHWGVPAVVLPALNEVLPGDTASFAFSGTAPATPGTYPFAWQMYENTVADIGNACIRNIVVTPSSSSASSSPSSVSSESAVSSASSSVMQSSSASSVAMLSSSAASSVAPVDDAECTLTVPERALTRQSFDAILRLRNTGNTTWTYPAYYLVDKDWQKHMSYTVYSAALPSAVAPGETAELLLSLTAPAMEGMYSLQWQILHNPIAYFGDVCAATLKIELPPPYCGDGVANNGEECDDGNRRPADGCSPACKRDACGDTFVSANEECDDGNVIAGDGCDARCLFEYCGDGIVQEALGEQCDTGTRDSLAEGCTGACRLLQTTP